MRAPNSGERDARELETTRSPTREDSPDFLLLLVDPVSLDPPTNKRTSDKQHNVNYSITITKAHNSSSLIGQDPCLKRVQTKKITQQEAQIVFGD